MKKVIVRAPVRADLAGGTLDLWPLYLFHPGSRTVNVAISYFAESEVCQTDERGIELHLTDSNYKQRYESAQELAKDEKASLIWRAIEHFKLDGLRITTRTDAPRGSGLGGSSALAITLVRALSEIAGTPVEGEELINLVRDLETRLLGIPAGIQDYYPPVFGGLGSLHLNPGKPSRHPLSTPIPDLASHMLLHYTGVAHFSGTNNWELYKRQIEGKKKVQKGLENIAQTAIEMERALEAGNFEAAGRTLAEEWEHRKAMIEGISTPEIEAAVSAAHAAGAWGAKVCGAGGGGCIVFLFPPEKREGIVEALGKVPGQVLDVTPVAHGLTIERDQDAAPIAPLRSRLVARRVANQIEQLYVYGGSGEYRPYLLAESVITHSEGRSGIHHTAVRSYVAPIESEDGKVLWHRASQIEPERLDIRAVPDPQHKVDPRLSPEVLVQQAAASEEGFRQFIEENERLQVFHNPAFGMWSEPNETKQQFLERCLEEANRRLENNAERLESTFRRRIDQLRERSDREQREIESTEETDSPLPKQDVNVAWGQTLYNITSGRPAAIADAAPASTREGDYLEHIAQIQRAWDKELQGMREELTARARSIEDVTIAPVQKNIEVTKYVILWAAALP